MIKKRLFEVFLVSFVMLGVTPCSYAGSDRLIMSMTVQRMDQEDIVYARFLGSDGTALESSVLNRMVIREQDCSSGHILKLIKDYKIGYAPKSMLVGIYLYPQPWKNKTLCFSVPNLGKVEQILNPKVNNGRSFQLKLAP